MEGQPRTHLNLPLEELAEDQASSSHASDGEQLGVDDAVKQSSELPAERYPPSVRILLCTRLALTLMCTAALAWQAEMEPKRPACPLRRMRGDRSPPQTGLS